MRSLALVVALLLSAVATAQLRPLEAKALDDAMTLANVRPADLAISPTPGSPRALTDALADPTTGAVVGNGIHTSATPDELALLRTALGLVGTAMPRSHSVEAVALPSTVALGLQRPVGLLVAAIAACDADIRAALAPLSADERRMLIEALPRLAADDGRLPLDYARLSLPDFATVRRSLDKVDVPRIEAAGMMLAERVREAMPALQAMRGRAIPRQIFRVQGVLVELAGNGDDTHDRKDVNLCIDLGGNDRYVGRYAAGIGYASVLIDLEGNDRYGGPDANYGCGVLGVGLAYDLSGEDVWRVRTGGLGCGLAGVGVAYDGGGDDRYRVVDLGLGAGFDGIGLFVDRSGDDAYDAGHAAQGFGSDRGLGWSLDGGGSDFYRGGRQVQASAGPAGFGLLTDLSGDDVYVCRSGQASASGGYASLGDLSGDDRYTAEGRAQGFAEGGGFALLVDAEGDDSYLLREGPGQAAAFRSAAILWDRAGDDVYAGTDQAPADAHDGGFALLLEGGGDDRYLDAPTVSPAADGVSLWADAGGRDRYGDGRTDGQAEVARDSAALDEFGGGEAPVEPPSPPQPDSLPMPSSDAFEELRRRAVSGPEREAALDRLSAIGLPALEAMARRPGEAFVLLAKRLGAAAAPTVATMVRSNDLAQVRAGLRTAGAVPLPSEAVVGALANPALAQDAARAAGRGKIPAARDELARLAASDDPATALAAVQALVQLGDPASASTGAALLESSVPAVRRSAFRLASLQGTVALAAGMRLATSSDPFKQRIGLALLGTVDSPAADKALASALSGGRDAKIGALLALSGRVPAELLSTVEALRRDPDPLVRAVAERVDAGP